MDFDAVAIFVSFVISSWLFALGVVYHVYKQAANFRCDYLKTKFFPCFDDW
jgi:hypothetical protein